MTIAIVGNSPKILEKEWGEEIDSHDEVLRFNDFQIDGYEKHTGKKITMISICCAVRNYKNYNLFISLPVDHRLLAAGGTQQKVQQDLNKIFNGQISTNDITYPENKIFKLIQDRMPSYCNNQRFASSGIIMMEYILDRFPDAQIDAYGFTFFHDSYENYYRPGFKTGDWHDGNKEQWYFNTYLKDKINLYI